MQYELRTRVIEPKRHTFDHLVKRYGDRPASRYEEGSVGVQAVEHFHYRPLWAPDKELYDASWSVLRLSDPDAFLDPRQYYYAPYVTARAAFHDGVAKGLDYLDSRDLLVRLPQAWRSLMTDLLVPLRHYESGAQLVSVAWARFAYGTTVEQCCSFAAFDRIGLAQVLSRIGLALADGSDAVLLEAKQCWMAEPALQGLRRYVEELLVEQDWALALIGLDLCDRLLYSLLHRHLDEAALLGGAGAYSLLSQHFGSWFTGDQRRWLDALVVAWTGDPEHGAANRVALAALVERQLPQAAAAVRLVAEAADARVDADCVATHDEQVHALRRTCATAFAAAPSQRSETSA